MPTIKMVVPADKSGEVHCNAVGQSGVVYRNIVPGSVMDIDIRDLPVFQRLGYYAAPTGAVT